MARPNGVRNHDFAEKRAALLDRLTDHALSADLRRPSLRQFAIAADTSEPTLRHYFTNRSGLVVAILQTIGRRGRVIWEAVSAPASCAEEAVGEYLRISEAGMRHGGFVRAHAFGIIEGVADPAAGHAYLKHVLEPALEALRRKLSATDGCPSDPGSLQAAALVILSPLLVMSLHQDLLGGREALPIESGALTAQMETWLGQALSASSG
ncbi:MAG: hypothetical protein KDA53_14410 [Hyphomonas sp.]|nr:hypothetical protein [Hyphomonas sp.]